MTGEPIFNAGSLESRVLAVLHRSDKPSMSTFEVAEALHADLHGTLAICGLTLAILNIPKICFRDNTPGLYLSINGLTLAMAQSEIEPDELRIGLHPIENPKNDE